MSEEVEEQLLADLLSTQETINYAPSGLQLHGKWYSLTIGIGTDHTAQLLIDDEALTQLCVRHRLNKDGVLINLTDRR